MVLVVVGLGGHVNIWQGSATTAGGHALVGMCRGVGSEGSVGGEWVLVPLLLLVMVVM